MLVNVPNFTCLFHCSSFNVSVLALNKVCEAVELSYKYCASFMHIDMFCISCFHLLMSISLLHRSVFYVNSFRLCFLVWFIRTCIYIFNCFIHSELFFAGNCPRNMVFRSWLSSSMCFIQTVYLDFASLLVCSDEPITPHNALIGVNAGPFIK